MEDLEAEIARMWNQPLSFSDRLKGDLLWAWRLVERSRNYDAVVAGSDRMSRLFGVAQRVLRRKRVPLLFIDWYCEPCGGRLRRRIQRTGLRWALRGATAAIVQGKDEIAAFANELGVPASKFIFLPYHSTLYDFQYAVEEGDYIFTGGDTHRDYATLIEAVRGLPYRVVIGALSRNHFHGIQVPENVDIVTLSLSDFFQKMAGAALVVVPMLPRFLHPGGQQTWINAMSMGKPVIVAEDRSACDYIVHGSTGWLVKPGDPTALREAVSLLMEDRHLARTMGRRAKEAAAAFAPEAFFEKVFALIDGS